MAPYSQEFLPSPKSLAQSHALCIWNDTPNPRNSVMGVTALAQVMWGGGKGALEAAFGKPVPLPVLQHNTHAFREGAGVAIQVKTVESSSR